jgi:biotin carboxyl carrier protein
VSDHPEHAVPRSLEQRLSDHVAIDRLADDLLPALVAKLSASGLGELEVREGPWKVRLRRPPREDAVPIGPGGHPMRRATDRAVRSQPGHADHAHAPGTVGHGEAVESRLATAAHASHGAPSRDEGDGGPVAKPVPGDTHRLIAASPAVGIYRPRAELRPGMSVRAGDRLGVVDVLGVSQEVVSPADGLVGARLAEGDQPVEYGQELLIIELLAEGPAAGSSTDAGTAAGGTGTGTGPAAAEAGAAPGSSGVTG